MSVRTSPQNFLNRSRALVQKFSPYLEFINERALIATLLGADGETIDLNNLDADTSPILEKFSEAFLNFQSGGLLAAEFFATMLALITPGDESDNAAQANDLFSRLGYALCADSIAQIVESSENVEGSADEANTVFADSEATSSSVGESTSRANSALNAAIALSKFALVAPVAGTAFDIFNLTGDATQPSTTSLTGNPAYENEVQRRLLEAFQDPTFNTTATSAERRRVEARIRRSVARSFNRPINISSYRDFPLININKSLTNPNPQDPDIGPNIVAILVNSIDLTPANRDTGISELFMNFIPSIEMSRAVPFIDLSFCSNESSNSSNLNEKIPSLTKILGFGDFPNSNPSVEGSERELDFTTSGIVNNNILTGIELFTSPQTLISRNRFVESDISNTTGVGSASNSIDVFRPPISFKGITIDVVSSGAGLISHKKAKMSLVVHDRGRLKDFASFIKPDLYSSTHMLIEYGWSHPDNNIEKNAFGYLINTLRAIEKYTIINSSFSMNETGEVTIDLELFAQGSETFAFSDISRGEGVDPIIEQINEITKTINQALQNLRQNQNDAVRVDEIFTSQILGSITSTDSSITGRSDDLNEQLAEFIRGSEGNTDSNISSIRERLIDLYGEDPTNQADTGALTNQLSATIAASLTRKNQMLSNNIDPFLNEITLKTISASAARSGNFANNDLQISPQEYVSLGKLLMIYIARPLAATKKFKEIQLLFYPFNDKASNMHNLTTASFPIKRQLFVDALNKETKLTANLPLSRFGAMLNREFVANQASDAYGFSNLYQQADENGRRDLIDALEGQQTRVSGLKQSLLRTIYGGANEEAVFSMPSITFYTEPVYISRGEQDGQTNSANPESALFDTILRIHIFDQRASSRESAIQIYKAALSNKISAIRRPREQQNDTVGHQAAARATIERAIEAGILQLPNVTSERTASEEQIPTTYTLGGGINKIKAFIRKVVPTVRYGTQGSAVIKASFQSNADPLMGTAHILNAQSGRDVPPGVSDGGLPLQISPTTLSMTTIGFPWFNYGQQFFVDFDTGTTADNVYGITSVQHTIAPGSFTTDLSLIRTGDAFGEYRTINDDIANALTVIRQSAETIE